MDSRIIFYTLLPFGRIISTITLAFHTLTSCNACFGAVCSRNFVCAIGGEGKGQS